MQLTNEEAVDSRGVSGVFSMRFSVEHMWQPIVHDHAVLPMKHEE
jgi:hypothetical protein